MFHAEKDKRVLAFPNETDWCAACWGEFKQDELNYDKTPAIWIATCDACLRKSYKKIPVMKFLRVRVPMAIGIVASVIAVQLCRLCIQPYNIVVAITSLFVITTLCTEYTGQWRAAAVGVAGGLLLDYYITPKLMFISVCALITGLLIVSFRQGIALLSKTLLSRLKLPYSLP